MRLLRYLILCLCFGTSQVFAQENYLQNISVEDGLPQSEVNTMIQDSRGYLWIGTSAGVGVYNGRAFRVFDQSNGLSGDIVQCLIEDDQGIIYVGSTWGGIAWFDGLRWQYIKEEQGLPSNAVKSLAFLKGTVFALAGNSIVKIENRLVKSVHNLVEGQTAQILTIIDEKVVVGTDREVLVYDVGLKLIKRVDVGGGVMAVSPWDNGLAVATDEGFVYLNKDLGLSKKYSGVVESFKEFENLPIRDVFADKDGGLWITVREKGIFKILKNGELTHYNQLDLFNGHSLSGVFQDREGIIWVKTFGRGLFKLMAKPLEKFTLNGYREGSIFGFEQDKEGNMYFLDITRGVLRSSGKDVQKIIGLETGVKRFLCMSHHPDGTLYLGTDDGLMTWKKGVIQKLNVTRELPSQLIRSMLIDKDSTIWLGIVRSGLYRLKGRDLEKVGDDLFDNVSIHCIFRDSRGVLWLGTGFGLFQYEQGKFSQIGERQGLCNSYVGSITEDKNGRIWVSTDNCVAVWDGDKFHNWNRNNGLASNVFYFLISDAEGRIWVGSNNGLDCLTLDDQSKVVTIKHYGKGEGYTGIECNARGAFIDREKGLWFASIDGPFRYRKELDTRNEYPPILHLKAIKIFFDEEITYGYMKGELDWYGLPKKLVLPSYHNHLTFEVDGLNFFSPFDIKYSYKMEGVDKNWTPLTSVSSVTYSNLPPGTYYFKVKAYNSDGVAVEEAVTYGPIIIEPEDEVAVVPYWMWVTLILLASGLLLFVGYALITRDRRMKKMRRILEEKVKSRTVEVEKQNLEKEVMLKEIHHRVKNNLQIINSLMNLQADSVDDEMVKDVFREARNRIASMALIHEKIYENRSMVNVRMKDYIRELVHKLIDSYKIADNVRLQMNIGDDVLMNLNHIVPVGLILNEIISNSLKYAFPGDQKGRIYIELKSQPDGSYLLVAGDDGVGLPQGYDVTKMKTLGIELIHMLTEQLGGTLEVRNEGGLMYVLIFGSAD